MTNEKAIKILRNAIKKPNTKDGYLGQALDMGIKALESQPCEDCISREAVIRLVEQYPNIIGNRCSGLIADIKHLPPVTPSYNSIKTELKPCEDCISRQVVKDMLTAEWTKYMPMELDMNLSFVLDKISALPSVTPTRPKGKWIQTKDDCDGVNFYDFSFECSKCGKEQSFKSSYCPICGAYMRESEETK